MGFGSPQVLPIPFPSFQPSQGWGTPILLTPLFLSRRALGPQGAARCHFKRPGSPEPHAEPAPRSVWTRPKPAGLPWGRVPSDRARSPSPGTPWAQRTRRPRRCGSWWARRAVSIGGPPRPQFPLFLRKGFLLATVGKPRGLETLPKTVTCAPHLPTLDTAQRTRAPGLSTLKGQPRTRTPRSHHSRTPSGHKLWKCGDPPRCAPDPCLALGGWRGARNPCCPVWRFHGGLAAGRRVQADWAPWGARWHGHSAWPEPHDLPGTLQRLRTPHWSGQCRQGNEVPCLIWAPKRGS